MVWRIHRWSEATRTGEVVSPHFGPWPFGPGENVDGTTDFEVGEEVHVELDGPEDAYTVRTVIAAWQRQPAGTECPAFAALDAARPGAFVIEAWDDRALRLWGGDCCRWCTPDGWIVTFHDPVTAGLDEDTDLDSPLVRHPTDQELAAHGVTLPEGRTAFCIVTGHGYGRDGPSVIVMASAVDVARER